MFSFSYFSGTVLLTLTAQLGSGFALDTRTLIESHILPVEIQPSACCAIAFVAYE